MPKPEERKTNPKPDAIPAVPAAPKPKAETIGVRLEEDLRKDVERICVEEKIPTAVLIRQAVQNYVGNPNRQRDQVLQSMAITRAQIERAQVAGVIPEETAARLLQELEDGRRTVKAEKRPRNPAPFRFPQAPFLHRLLWGDEE